MSQPLILIAVPVLDRPHAVAPLVASIRAATRTPHRILFLCNAGDTAEIAACDASGCDVDVGPSQPRPGDWARKINHAYRSSVEPYLLLAADDLVFHPGWDVAALAYAERGFGVVGTDDMGNGLVMRGDHATHPLVARAYVDACGTVDECGVVVHEGYRHNCPDVELVETAKARGAWAFAAGAKVEHLHPFWRKGADDATYRLGRAGYAVDQALLARRRPLWQRIAA